MSDRRDEQLSTHEPGSGADETPAEFRQYRFALPPDATEVILVRHGESAPARVGEPFPLTDGHGDPPLAPDGHRQAEAVAAHLHPQAPAAVYVTTLRRTHQTAAPLASALAVEPVVEADLREVYLGEWEGGLFRQKAAEGDPIFQRVVEEQEWGHIPGAESTAAFAARLVPAVGRLASRHRGTSIVAVVHGGVIGALVAQATGAAPFTFVGADNGSITRLIVDDHRWSVRTYNEIGHL